MPLAVIGSQVRDMFGSIAERYDLTNSVLSMGVHRLWRWRLQRLLGNSSDGVALDLCTGTGDLLPLLKARFGHVVGADFCLPMLKAGRKKLAPANLDRKLLQGDGLCLPFAEGAFDAVTVAFGVRNFEDLRKGLSEIRRVLKADGKLYVLEFGQPRSKIFGKVFGLYSNTVMPWIGGVLTGNRAAYTYLPKTSAAFPCRQAFEQILRETGLEPERTISLTGGIAYLYSARKM